MPAGAARAVDLVRAPEHVRAAVETLLADVVVVDDLAAARAIVAVRPDLVVATRTGDVLSQHRASGGSATAPSALHLQAALDTRAPARATATADGERLRFELSGATEALTAAREAHERTLDRLNESDAALAAVAEQLGHLGSTARAANAEAARLQAVAGGRVADARGRQRRAGGAHRAARGGGGRAGRERGGDRRGQRPSRPAGRAGVGRARPGDRGAADPADR